MLKWPEIGLYCVVPQGNDSELGSLRISLALIVDSFFSSMDSFLVSFLVLEPHGVV